MIKVNKLDGKQIFINAECIQSVERTPDTLITLTNGFKLLVQNSIEEILEAFRTYQREIHQGPKEATL